MRRILINAFGFNVGWFGCVLSSRYGMPLAALAVVGLLLALHLLVITPKRDRKAELGAVAVVALIGTLIDSGMLVAGVLRFGDTGALTPVFIVWIACFWANFAMTLSVSIRWLGRMPIVAAIVGAISAPGTYYFGARLSELELATPLRFSFTVLAIEWAVLLPACFAITRRIRSRGAADQEPGGVPA